MTETMENLRFDTDDCLFTRTDSPSAFIPQDFRQPSEDDDCTGLGRLPKDGVVGTHCTTKLQNLAIHGKAAWR